MCVSMFEFTLGGPLFLVSPPPGHPLRWAESRASLEGENWVAQTSLQQQQRLLWSLKGILSFSISTDVCISPSPSQDRLGLASALAHIPKGGSDQPSPAISGFRGTLLPSPVFWSKCNNPEIFSRSVSPELERETLPVPHLLSQLSASGVFQTSQRLNLRAWRRRLGDLQGSGSRRVGGRKGSCGREWDAGFMFQLSSSEALWPEECCPPSWSETAY